MSSLALLRVSARTDLPDIAAVGIIFLKLAGSSDTMQTVERRGGATAHARPDGAGLQLHTPEICAPAARGRAGVRVRGRACGGEQRGCTESPRPGPLQVQERPFLYWGIKAKV